MTTIIYCILNTTIEKWHEFWGFLFENKLLTIRHTNINVINNLKKKSKYDYENTIKKNTLNIL